MRAMAGDATTEGMKGAGFYDAHSEYQRRVIEGGDELIGSAVAAIDLERLLGAFVIADYGAGTGATSVHAVGTAITALRARDADLPVLAIHNDVATTDFNELLRNVTRPGGYTGSSDGPVYPAAVPGSFFTQVVPSGSVHLGMCSNAAHWLRTQPSLPTPDGMYFADSHGDTRRALAEQAAADWLAFLQSRAAELSSGGRLVVQGIGSGDDGRQASAGRLLRVMWQAAVSLADDGLLDRAVLDDYVFPVYCRTEDEVTAPVRPGGPLAGGRSRSSPSASTRWRARTGRRTSDTAMRRRTRRPTSSSCARSPSRRCARICSSWERGEPIPPGSSTSTSTGCERRRRPTPRPAATKRGSSGWCCGAR